MADEMERLNQIHRDGTFGYLKLTKTVTFSDSTGTISLFTVTGDVIVQLVSVCTTNVASVAAGNVEVGTSGDTDAILPTTLGTDLDAREIWHDSEPVSEIEPLDSMRQYIITDGNDIVMTLSAQIDSGALTFYCYWNPLSSDGRVVVA